MKPRDRDFIETKDGSLFCVVGYLHPPDKVTAYLKYIPSESGKWARGASHYTRTMDYYHVTQVENTYNYLKKHHPDYIFKDPVRNITVSAVPKKMIKKYYCPRERLLTILEDPKDILEKKLCEITDDLIEYLEIKNNIGVTGSLLTGSHNPTFSDLDITVYGKKNMFNVKQAVADLKKEGVIRRSSERELNEWCMQRSEKFSLSINDLKKIAVKRWNFGYYKDTYFSFHLIRSDEEIKEEYGDYVYNQLGEIKGNGVVDDVSESMYNPAIYGVRNSSLEKIDEHISKIVSFESIYGGLFEVGDFVEFQGILERVQGKKVYNRIVLGGAGSKNSYIKLG